MHLCTRLRNVFCMHACVRACEHFIDLVLDGVAYMQWLLSCATVFFSARRHNKTAALPQKLGPDTIKKCIDLQRKHTDDEELPRLLATMCTCLDKPMRLSQHLISVQLLEMNNNDKEYRLPRLKKNTQVRDWIWFYSRHMACTGIDTRSIVTYTHTIVFMIC